MIQPAAYTMLTAPFRDANTAATLTTLPTSESRHDAPPAGGGPRHDDHFLAVKEDETYVENAKALVGLLKVLATSAF